MRLALSSVSKTLDKSVFKLISACPEDNFERKNWKTLKILVFLDLEWKTSE